MPIPDAFDLWLLQYGSIALFILLFLGVLVLPLPQNALVLLAGVFIAQGKLMILPAFLAIFVAVILALTLTYWIGRTAGSFLLEKYGFYLGVTLARLQRVHRWYERAGKWTLFFGYYLPIVRRLMGYAAGMGQLSFQQFALFAYTGAFFWTLLLLAIGYGIGHQL
ncbi:MAG: DedA family protein [Gammaproteobacteria bacterium]|nr:MAG: DedA family protein [Gammaproteobacteria bacterium]